MFSPAGHRGGVGVRSTAAHTHKEHSASGTDAIYLLKVRKHIWVFIWSHSAGHNNLLAVLLEFMLSNT